MSATKTNVVYEKVDVHIYDHDNQLTATKAMEYVGWQEVPEGSPYHITDSFGKTILLANNGHNRPFNYTIARTYMKEILQGNWQLNGETMIIGKSGENISCQHRMVALILAVQEWNAHKDRFPFWTTEPTIPCIVVVGIDEDDKTVNTIDTGKPRSLTDVLYRSEFFGSMGPKERKEVSRIAADSIKWVHARTTSDKKRSDMFIPGTKRTHSESIEFLGRHNRLLECVKSIYEEDQAFGVIQNHTKSRGDTAGALYFMGSCSSDPEKYYAMDIPDETALDWTMWDQASFFIAGFAQKAVNLKPLSDLLTDMVSQDEASKESRMAILAKAWKCYVEGKESSISVADLKLQFTVDEATSVKMLDEFPTFGGIDKGPAKDAPIDTASEAQAIKEEKHSDNNPLKPHKPSSGFQWKNGEMAWVDSKEFGIYRGRISSWSDNETSLTCKLKVEKGFQGAGTTRVVEKKDLRQTQPLPQEQRPTTPAPAPKKPKKSKAVKELGGFKVNTLAWASIEGEDVWRGKIIGFANDKVLLEVLNGFQGAGTNREVPVTNLSKEQPGAVEPDEEDGDAA